MREAIVRIGRQTKWNGHFYIIYLFKYFYALLCNIFIVLF